MYLKGNFLSLDLISFIYFFLYLILEYDKISHYYTLRFLQIFAAFLNNLIFT